MLLVKTKLAPSPIHGIGLFADEFIPKGMLVQQFMPGVDLVFEMGVVENLPPVAKNILLNYAYKHKITGRYTLNTDDAQFLNHSESPNLIEEGSNGDIDVAARDIQKGEELTVNYREFDAEVSLSSYVAQ